MYYYEVAPSGRTYQGADLLTYSSDFALSAGQIIVVMLRTHPTYAFAVRQVNKPSFKALPITKIIENYVIPQAQLQLFEWMRLYYPSSVGSTAGLFTPPSINKKQTSPADNDVANTTDSSSLPELTQQQKSIAGSILDSHVQTHILHGDTGTGKTRLYIELAEKIIMQNKSVLLLTPEISLTPQLFEQFNSIFANVHLVHSGLTIAQRRGIWEKMARTAGGQIIIGPRSALFYPVSNLGLTIIDEFHDSAYKQEQAPRYNALRVAAKLANITGTKLVLGSATPPVEDYFYATSKGTVVHRMTEKPLQNHHKKNILIVDLSDKTESSKHPLLSNSLLHRVSKHLNQKQQILLFINKRGSSRLVICQNCGWHADCPRCNIPYTYHADNHELQCHICNSTTTAPTSCPECKSVDILFKNPGTKAIVDSLEKIYPNAKIGRYDKDNKKNETFSAKQSEIANGTIDILVGTQLLAKGHDLPNLGLVGILLAEANRQFPDYNSEERSFQLLHQLSGRVGRGHLPGEVVVQTYDPKSTSISYLNHSKDDWTHFYSTELQQRKKYNFPPYCYMLKIETSRKTEKSAENFIQKIHQQLTELNDPEIELLGPAPAFFYKRSDRYHWQIIVKSKRRSSLIDLIKTLPNGCTYDIDPISLL